MHRGRAAIAAGFLWLGGALPACGRVASESEDASGGSGTLGSGGAKATGGAASEEAAGGTSDALAIAAWQAVVAPRSGPHEVSISNVCDSERIAPDYRIIPPVDCTLADDYVKTRTRDCDIQPYCETSADCTKGLRGRCEGLPSSQAVCFYPSAIPMPCSADGDCAPGGTCRAAAIPSGDVYCYPTGACAATSCSYPEEPCASSADCQSAEGGECIQPIRYTACRYETCTQDEDCSEDERCDCSSCVVAECHSEDDCPQGETCEVSRSECSVAGLGYYCTTPDDECEPDEDGCKFGEGMWRFLPMTCP